MNSFIIPLNWHLRTSVYGNVYYCSVCIAVGAGGRGGGGGGPHAPTWKPFFFLSLF